MMKFVFLLCAIITVGALPSERPRILCGRALAEARIFFCYGPEIAEEVKRNYNAAIWTVKKRTPSWTWLTKSIYKRGPGLVDECCLKPCYMNELLSYC